MARHFPKIEGYTITSILGHGGMGIVYRAVQEKLNRVVALKVLPAVVGTANPSAVARFRREASAAARLHHTNIVPIYDFGESRDTYYFAMELITGKPLNVMIPRFAEDKISKATFVRLWQWLHLELSGSSTEPVGEDPGSGSDSRGDFGSASSATMRKGAYYHQVAHWISDVAEALHYAHGQHIIHRDIKPGNLILSSDMRIMIADFGLAKTGEEESLTATGSLIGTLRYLSPEQAMAKRIRVDHRTDVYSLGATLYELLCFRPAFSGRDEKEILGAIIARDPTPPQRINTSVPIELATICLKCLEKSPDARYATAKGLADDMHRYLHDLPIVARPPNLVRRLGKFVRRHRMGVIITVAGLLVTAAAYMWTKAVRQQEQTRKAEIAVQIESLLTEAESARTKLGKNRDFAKYASLFERALRLDTNHVRTLGDFAIFKKDWFNSRPGLDPALLTEADAHLDRALAIDPDRLGLWNAKGVILKKLGKYDEAADAYNAAIALQPEQWAAWVNLGNVMALAGDLSGAKEKLERSCELTGKEMEQCEYSWQNLAAVELALGHPGALDHIENALHCNRASASAVALRAMSHLQTGSTYAITEALKDADRADFLAEDRATEKTTRARIKRVLALAHLRGGAYAEAVTASVAAIDLGDLRTVNYLIQAIAEAHLGARTAADTHLGMADQQWPAKLKEKGSYDAVAPTGVLWIDSADALYRLRDEAVEALESRSEES